MSGGFSRAAGPNNVFLKHIRLPFDSGISLSQTHTHMFIRRDKYGLIKILHFFSRQIFNFSLGKNKSLALFCAVGDLDPDKTQGLERVYIHS